MTVYYCARQLERSSAQSGWKMFESSWVKLLTSLALCGRKFENASAMMKHLTSEHLADMHKAHDIAKHLQDHFQPFGAACMCGSWQAALNAQHVCPVATQLGIMKNVAKANLPPPGTGNLPRLMDAWIAEEVCGNYFLPASHATHEFSTL